MNEITYTTVNDVQIPNLTLPETEPIGRYGRMRQRYLKENRPVLWNHLVLTGTLYEHLHEIETAAQSRIDLMLPKLAAEAGATEELKATDPLKWTGLMNNCKAQVEESVLSELIYN